MTMRGLVAGFVIGAVIVIAHKAGRSIEAPSISITAIERGGTLNSPGSETSAVAGEQTDDTPGAAARALASVVDESFSLHSIDDVIGALTAVEQRAFQLELVSEWAAADGDAALLYASRLEPSLRRHALQRVGRVRTRDAPIEALRAERYLQARDAFEYRRSLLAEWAALDLAGLYDYLEQTEITPDLAASFPHNALTNDPDRLLALAERTPGTDGLVLTSLASGARQ